MDTNTIKENYREVVHNFKSKLKLPIVLTYSIILTLYNWDIIYYLTFHKDDTLVKIGYIKNIDNDWFHRILIPILISIFYALLFPILQVGINYLFRWFKNQNNKLERKEELSNAKHRFQVQTEISGSQTLENLNIQIANLNNDKEHLNEQIIVLVNEKDYLLNENKKLIQKFDESKTNSFNNPKNEIIKSRAEKLLENYSNFSEEEKASFIEILKYFNKNKVLSIWKSNISEVSTFPLEAKRIIQVLLDNDILDNFYSRGASSPDLKSNNYGNEIIKYLLENHFE